MRVAIPPIGVLLCAYKLGFGLVKKLDRKFEKFQKPLCLGSPDSMVCTEHCTAHCPVHRPRARRFPFCCALSGGSLDNYCAIFGVHWTCTVDCLVRS
jgi:hypothetical protein